MLAAAVDSVSYVSVYEFDSVVASEYALLAALDSAYTGSRLAATKEETVECSGETFFP